MAEPTRICVAPLLFFPSLLCIFAFFTLFLPPCFVLFPPASPAPFRLCFYCDLLLECSVSGAVAAEDGALELRCERAVGAGAAAG